MNCRKAERWILLMRSGELPMRKRFRLERHVSDCPRCRAYQDDMDRIMTAVEEALPSGEPGATTMDAIRNAARSSVRKSETPAIGYSIPLVFVKWRPVLACAALVLICVVGWYLLAVRRSHSVRAVVSLPPSSDARGEMNESVDDFYELSVVTPDDIVCFERLSDLAQRPDVSLVDRELMILEGLAI